MQVDLIKFEDFELDGCNYSLRRSGAILKLERIPMELLLLLAGRAGELVTREQIIEKLWGKDVYLDTENAINTAIRKIRLALGDDPAQPRFVQTVTGRGYRFIAAVASQSSTDSQNRLEEAQIVPAFATPSEQTDARVPKLTADDKSTVFSIRVGAKKRWPFAVLAVAVLSCSALGLIAMWSNSSMLRASNYAQITNDGRAKQGPLLTDGLRLYFSEGTTTQRALAQVSTSGGETATLSNPLETPYVMDIAPSRGELLAGSFSPGPDKTFVPVTSSPALWILSLPAGGARRAGGVIADDATWSPDGRSIAYGKSNALYRAGSDGSAETKLADLPGAPSWLRWSRDGTRLRFTVTENNTGFSSIWEISADGKNLRLILPGRNQVPSECCGNWTPDGKYFVFQSTRDGKTEIWAVKEKQGLFLRGSSEPKQLTSGQMNSLAPVVSAETGRSYMSLVSNCGANLLATIRTPGSLCRSFREYRLNFSIFPATENGSLMFPFQLIICGEAGLTEPNACSLRCLLCRQPCPGGLPMGSESCFSIRPLASRGGFT